MKLAIDITCTAEEVAQAVCAAFNITRQQLVYAPKSKAINFARGLYCATTVIAGIHPKDAAHTIQRSRASVITVAKHYKGYLEVGDQELTNLYNAIIQNLLTKHGTGTLSNKSVT